MSAELDKVGEGSSSQDGIMSIPKNDPPFRLSRAGKDVAFGSVSLTPTNMILTLTVVLVDCWYGCQDF